MKINEIQKLMGVQAYRKDTNQRTSETSGKKARQTDEVHISQEAFKLQGTQGTERSKHIQELKQQVSAGTYQVDASKIAEKLLPYLNE